MATHPERKNPSAAAAHAERRREKNAARPKQVWHGPTKTWSRPK